MTASISKEIGKPAIKASIAPATSSDELRAKPAADKLELSARVASARRPEPEVLADVARRASVAAGPGTGATGLAMQAGKTRPGTVKRVAAGAALATVSIWAPIGILWQFGLNLGTGLRSRQLSPAASFTGAVRSVRQEVTHDWDVATGQAR